MRVPRRRPPRPSSRPTSWRCAPSPPAIAAGCRSTCPSSSARRRPDGTRAVVYELPARRFRSRRMPSTGHVGVSGSIGRSIAAIHGLPTAFIGDAGLPQQSAAGLPHRHDRPDRPRRRHRQAARRAAAPLGTGHRRRRALAVRAHRGPRFAERRVVPDRSTTPSPRVLGWSALQRRRPRPRPALAARRPRRSRRDGPRRLHAPPARAATRCSPSARCSTPNSSWPAGCCTASRPATRTSSTMPCACSTASSRPCTATR